MGRLRLVGQNQFIREIPSEVGPSLFGGGITKKAVPINFIEQVKDAAPIGSSPLQETRVTVGRKLSSP